jgi:hypothetical protein
MLLTITTTHQPATDLGYLLAPVTMMRQGRGCFRPTREETVVRSVPASIEACCGREPSSTLKINDATHF